ncbi:hypothetical protein AB1Y20_005035 [Prymnesium parvum]|uniref:EF-hand domain-containing protein n=1 Tax=Prymnesium parvum TaxID=97485 RepID=A0AB34J641_PRYPA
MSRAPSEPASPRASEASAPRLSRGCSSRTLKLRMHEAFQLIDKNGDGTLTRIEVIQACRHDARVRELLRLPETIRQEDGSRDEFELVFQRMDADDSKGVDFKEFATFWKREIIPFLQSLASDDEDDDAASSASSWSTASPDLSHRHSAREEEAPQRHSAREEEAPHRHSAREEEAPQRHSSREEEAPHRHSAREEEAPHRHSAREEEAHVPRKYAGFERRVPPPAPPPPPTTPPAAAPAPPPAAPPPDHAPLAAPSPKRVEFAPLSALVVGAAPPRKAPPPPAAPPPAAPKGEAEAEAKRCVTNGASAVGAAAGAAAAALATALGAAGSAEASVATMAAAVAAALASVPAVSEATEAAAAAAATAALAAAKWAPPRRDAAPPAIEATEQSARLDAVLARLEAMEASMTHAAANAPLRPNALDTLAARAAAFRERAAGEDGRHRGKYGRPWDDVRRASSARSFSRRAEGELPIWKPVNKPSSDVRHRRMYHP